MAPLISHGATYWGFWLSIMLVAVFYDIDDTSWRFEPEFTPLLIDACARAS
ncbi:hypothetical protein [Candidatus Sororendozoicomonas aggregata]|uniref:hypothetical protein n=1 Tax=Candidatus Sororendozoicomonas aggregata TaxID=3073239 RepID=UPI002ED3B730